MATATFDEHAAGYDAVASSRVGREYRRRVHQVISPLIDAGSHVLDLGCGTGIDAVWLATMTERVHAIDPSSEMVAIAMNRTAAHDNVTVAQGNIASIVDESRFDLILANFGAINCQASLPDAGQHINRLLRPGGHAVLVSMPPVSPLERLAALVGRDRSLWGRRVDGPTAVAGYEGLPVTYATAQRLAAAMPYLELIGARSLGLFLPSFEQRNLVEQRPQAAALLSRLDRLTSRIGGRIGWGDHIIAMLRKPQS